MTNTEHKLTLRPDARDTLRSMREILVDTINGVDALLGPDELDTFVVDALDSNVNQLSQLADALFNVPGETPKQVSLELALSLATVQDFTVDEVCRASKAWPVPDHLLENLVAVLQEAQHIRDRLGLPLHIRSAWRPNDNDSQHRFASALDLDLLPEHRTDDNVDRLRMVAVERWTHSNRDAFGSLVGLGFYSRPDYRIHIDVRHTASKGHRFWHSHVVSPYLQRYKSGERAPA